jgi:hypothetical protein
MYADQFAQSLANIVNDGRKKPRFNAEVLARKMRDSITGFETQVDAEEIETDAKGTDLVADIPLGDGESAEASMEGGTE